MSPKRKTASTETLDVTGLAEEWDSTEDIRDRLRAGHHLTHTECPNGDVPSCVKNSGLLIPILTQMSVLDTRPLPPIDDLRTEIEKIFNKNKRETTAEAADDIVKASWSLKKLCGFVKMKVRRKEVSTAPCLLSFCF